MPARLSPAQQRNAVSEGTAFGLVMLGYGGVPFNKLHVDLAFTRAWHAWPRTGRFPQVGTDLAKGLDGYIALTHASETKRTGVFLWERERGALRIYGRQSDWDSDDPTDVAYALSAIGGELDADDWTQLAQAFVDYLRPDLPLPLP